MFSQRKTTWDCKLLFVQFNYENKICTETTAAVLYNSWNNANDVDKILKFHS